ncbi:MAG: NAD(P)-dependent oxidoreductase [Myxococcota bacterium]
MARLSLDGKVLVTGASGFIGGRLRSTLEAGGSDVVSLRRGDFTEPDGPIIDVDYADVACLEKVIRRQRPAYVMHLAGVTKGRTLDDFREGNVMPTKNLLGALDGAGHWPQRFVLVSSLASYGPSKPDCPLRESDPRRPIEHYGASKLEAERAVEESGLPWTIMRPSGVYGPGDVDYFNLFQSAMSGINAFFGNRQRVTSMVYVDDCVRGIIQASDSAATVGRGYFLETEQAVSWETLQTMVVDEVGKRARTVDLPEALVSVATLAGEVMTRIDGKPRLLNQQKKKMGAQDAWTCTADAARADFGFEGEVALADGISRTHQWYLDQGWYRRKPKA